MDFTIQLADKIIQIGTCFFILQEGYRLSLEVNNYC